MNTEVANETLKNMTSPKEAALFASEMKRQGRYDLAALAEDRGGDLCASSAAAMPYREAANIARFNHILGQR